MKNTLLFIFTFIMILLVHFYLLFAIEIKKAIPLIQPQKTHSIVINLKKVAIKIVEPIPLPIEKKITPIIKEKIVKEVVVPIKKIKKRAMKRVKKRKKITKKRKKLKKHVVKKKVIKHKNILKKSSPNLKALKNRYLAKIRLIIEKHKKYPRIAQRMHQEGIVKVRFTIDKNGKIKNIMLVKKCSYSRLNKAGISTLKKIGRFKPIPKELHKSFLTLTVPIKYKIIH